MEKVGSDDADARFGPHLAGEFDFTLLFEQSILSILPSSLFIIAAAYRVATLYRKGTQVRAGHSLWLKLVCSVALIAVQVATVVLWSTTTGAARNETSIAASALGLVAALHIAVLEFLEHTRSIRPSVLLTCYIFLSVLLDIAQARSLWLRSELHTLAGVFVVSLILKTILLVLEEVPKTALLTEKSKGIAPESTSGLINRSVFWWLNSLFKQGYRALISPGDLSPLEEKLLSDSLLSSIQRRWMQVDKTSKHALLKATLVTFRLQLGAAVIPRLVFAGFLFAQPFLINRIVRFVSQSPSEFDHQIIGGLIGATALVYCGIAFTRCAYKHLTYQLMTMIRGGLISLIFQKTLQLDTDAITDSAPVTLMSTDIDGITLGFQNIHEIWGDLVQVAIGLYLLQTQVGNAGFLVVVPAFISSVIVHFMSKGLGPARVTWNLGVQKRVAVTSSMLSQIKSLKMMGLADYMERCIQGLRVAEVDLSKKFRGYMVWLNVIANGVAMIAPVSVIIAAVYLTRNAGLGVAEAFTALSIMVVVSFPLAELLAVFPSFMASVACFGRIQAFLLLDERKDYRLFLEEYSSSSVSQVGLRSVSQGSSDIELEPVRPGSTLPSLVREARDKDGAPIVEVAGAAFYTRDETEILHDIALSIPPSQLTVITGRVGCGKSTLLKAILGEMPAASGSVVVRTQSVAYCDQTPWLMNKSVRENVIGTSEFDEERYSRVVKACALNQDFDTLPDGDESIVGSGGIALSGGQRQRVALARAVYSRKKLLLLDDVFSGLDNTTSNAVFNRLLGSEGLLRHSGITVVLATHAVKFLPYADFITVLDSGSIKLNQVKYDMLDHEVWGIEESARGEISESAGSGTTEAKASKPPKTPAVKVAEPDTTRQTGDFGLYKFYFKSVGYTMCFIVIGLSTVYIFSSKLTQIWVRIWTERGTTANRGFYVGIYSLFAVIPCVAVYLTVWFYLIRVIPKSAQHLHLMLLEAVLAAPLYFFTTTDSGVTLNRFSQDMTLVDQVLPIACFTFIFDVLSVIAEAALIASGATYVAAIIPFCMAALYVLQKFYLRTSRQIRYLDLEAKSPLYTHFTETLSGLATIRAFGWKPAFMRISSVLLDNSQKPYYLLYCIQRWLNVVLDLFVAGMALILVAFALNFRSTTTGGAIGLAMLNIINFNTSLSQLINSWTNLETSLGAIARLRSFLAETPRESQEGERQVPPPGWPTGGAIEFRNITASYSPTTEPVLHNVSLTIKPGQKVGICGRTGSGKSSLILTLLHLLDLQEGSIRIDGIDLSLLPRQTIRSLLTTLPQDPVRLAGTVRENLDPHRSAPGDADLVSALARANVWAAVEARGGLDADMERLGLSGGQQQLFCLARAILHRRSSGVLVLDEATSSVDRETDGEIRRVVAEEFKGCTVVEVAHHLEAIAEYDVVVVMRDGRVAEVGDPRELLAGQTMFRALWDSQRG